MIHRLIHETPGLHGIEAKCIRHDFRRWLRVQYVSIESDWEGGMPDRLLSQESGFLLATTAASPLLRWVTAGLMAVLACIFVFAAAFANVPLARSDGFIPFIQATMFITELVTAVLLYTQFAIL